MPNRITLDITHPLTTTRLGVLLGQTAAVGDVVLLWGDLGAGKTTLTQSIGQGLGVPEDAYITSPTFALLHEYPGRIPLYHMDLYRLSTENDVLELGFEEYIYGDGICVIEWPDRLGSLQPEEHLAVRLGFTSTGGRQAELRANGPRWLAWLKATDFSQLEERAEHISST